MTTKIEVGQIYEDTSNGELLFVTEIITEEYSDPPYAHFYYLKAPELLGLCNSLFHAGRYWRKVNNGKV